MAAGSSSAIGRRPLSSVKRLGLLASCVLAVVILALVVPFALEARLSHRCAKLGGQLERSAEDVEPVVAYRSVYRCLDPGGQVLDNW